MSPNPDSSQAKNKGPKACTTCAKAKARCVPGPLGSLKCDRCLRLDKQCINQTPAPARPRRIPKLSKIAALEKRLEELSSHVQRESSEESSPTSPTEEAQPDPVSKSEAWGFNHLFPLKPESDNNPGQHPPPSAPDKTRPWDSWWPTPREAELLLNGYRTIHACLYPFVCVPGHMTALELREHRPFLWKAVMMVGCFLDGARQVKLGQELLAEIGRAAVIDGLNSLDLIQSLQMLIAWFHYALKGSQVTNLLFLARAVCVNLRFKEDASLQGEALDQNLNHMRVHVGTYYLNTLVFTANKRSDVLMNANHVDMCCRVLETTMQYPSDEYLVKLVRIQQLAHSISIAMSPENLSQTVSKLPLTMVVQSFEEQLQQYKDSLGPRLADNDNLKTHINVAEVLLYEVAVSDQHFAASYLPLTDRLQLLWACVRSLKAFFDIRFDHRELERPRFLCMSASELVYTIIVGIKVVTLQLPGWNLVNIHGELDMVQVMTQQAQDLDIIVGRRKHGNMLGTATPAGIPTPTPPPDPFERLVKQLKSVRDLVRAERQRLLAGSGNSDLVDFSQDFLMDDSGVDFWQAAATRGYSVWNIIGDPGVLNESH
ncbi:Zn2-C6 fungal-type domain-containing protein [Fusarium acuminatum]|uniref:Zn2-C6 fungal-type domain-containing protein n=1 Tax=Fusarium acuminatum TaxID=5515 RepID=A0ABZ2WY26_9HYPO